MEYTMSHFQDEALILLNNRFANRIQSVDIVEQALLLDGLLNGLQQKKLMNELAMKGGGALQRGYDSERFSSDLDFACGKYPPFTAKEFYQFGQDFCSDFKKIVHDTFDIQPDRINIYKEMGVDLVSLANNHVYDYGEDGLLDTIKYLDEYGIPNVGAGSNIDEAKEAYYFIAGGYKFSFISATRAEKYVVTPNAEENKPGVFWCYDPELLIATIKEEKNVSDFVIVLVHWGREDSHELEDVQKETGRLYIDAGADLIIGAHAHVLQGFEFYNNKLIAYNLGDFIFNRETKDTGILSVTVNKNGDMEYEFIPCKQNDFKTSILDSNERLGVINDMRSYSINTNILDDGKFYGNE